jgi:dTDP-3-amino-3,4,6-trideoxy-alpha-D-glucose transaminase
MNVEPDGTGSMVTIPQAAPGLRVAKYRAQIDAALARVLDGDAFILGPAVSRFEAAFARYLAAGRSNALHCVGVGSGTDAIALALRALGVGPGDEVVTTALAPSGTGQGVALTGARPIFADVDAETGCLDPASVARRISERTRAILVVHLYGLPADMAALGAVASAHGLALVEDCAHAHGAHADGRLLGTIGDAAAFSFYPTKNLGCLGDGGAVVSKDPEVVERVQGLRRYGWRPGDVVSHHTAGNSCLSEIQAAVLEALLPHLDQENEDRRAAAARYDEAVGHRARLATDGSRLRLSPICRAAPGT